MGFHDIEKLRFEEMKSKKRKLSTTSVIINELQETIKNPTVFLFEYTAEEAKCLILAFFEAHRRNKIPSEFYEV